MGEASTSETSVNFYQTTRRNSPEGSQPSLNRMGHNNTVGCGLDTAGSEYGPGVGSSGFTHGANFNQIMDWMFEWGVTKTRSERDAIIQIVTQL
jgi:hypothetical protein